MRSALAVLALLVSSAFAGETLVSDLEQRLSTGKVEGVNQYLGDEPSLMAELNQRAADCDPGAVALTVKLSRTKHAKAGDLHKEALRVAVGTCTELVLSLLSSREVPKICASVSSWSVTETARELRRRIRQIDADEGIRPTPFGRSCRDAYAFELQNTRVGIAVGRRNPQPR
jgi:hypothetical protein